jgi:uncharacterized protein (DUF2336 family)
VPHNAVRESVFMECKASMPAPDSSGGTPALSLIDELETAIARKDMRQQSEVMRRVTDLFMRQGAGFSKDHVDMFDEVMSRLVLAIENAARATFGQMLASLPNAPPKTSRLLALDNEIAVAGPVLSRSQVLTDDVLIETALTKSQDHLLAISQRPTIASTVTDVLVERGNQPVVVSTAANTGAEFSEFGFSTLATRAKDDTELARAVWLRNDIPRPHLLRLFAEASEAVRKELESADRTKTELYRYMIAEATNQIQAKVRERSEGYAAAKERVEALRKSGALDNARVMAFAQEKKFDETTVALSLLCDLPIGHIEQVIVHNHLDQLFVLTKAVDLSWDTTRAILLMQAGRSDENLEAACERFMRLQPTTARAALQFYRLRARAATPVAN